jgi:hypothetical protein
LDKRLDRERQLLPLCKAPCDQPAAALLRGLTMAWVVTSMGLHDPPRARGARDPVLSRIKRRQRQTRPRWTTRPRAAFRVIVSIRDGGAQISEMASSILQPFGRVCDDHLAMGT